MEPSSQSRCGDIASDLLIILITAAQLVFFAFFHRYIAWPATGPDGSVTRVSLLAGGYHAWLPFVIAASILVIAASIVMIVWDNPRFRQAAWIAFPILGIVVVVSLLVIEPFDFSVIPNAAAASAAPKAVQAFFVLLALFYAATVLVSLIRLKHRAAGR
jgi:hypothetical protein